MPKLVLVEVFVQCQSLSVSLEVYEVVLHFGLLDCKVEFVIPKGKVVGGCCSQKQAAVLSF
jgi:hypothetical protein